MDDQSLASLSAPERHALQAMVAFIFGDGDLQTAVSALRELATSVNEADEDGGAMLGIDEDHLTPQQRVRLADLQAALGE